MKAWTYDDDERNQVLEILLLLDTFAVNLLFGLDLCARNCSSVISVVSIVILNTISVTQRRIWDKVFNNRQIEICGRQPLKNLK